MIAMIASTSTWDIATATDTQGRALTGTLTLTQPPPPPRLAVGIDWSAVDQAETLATYPGTAYHRVFAANLPSHATGKMATLPATCIPHVSWRVWDEAALDAWLHALARPVWLTYHHEPMGDLDPALYRQRGAAVSRIVAGHPLVLSHGPVLTRYWLDQARGDVRDWWYSGATMLGVDCYNGLKDRYRDAPEMLATGALLARELGVPYLVPELGAERIGSDVDGTARAARMREWLAYLREVRATAVAWWGVGGTKLSPGSPEAATWQTAVALQ